MCKRGSREKHSSASIQIIKCHLTNHPWLAEIPAPIESQNVMSRMRDYPFGQ